MESWEESSIMEVERYILLHQFKWNVNDKWDKKNDKEVAGYEYSE